jgi:hypothetical protein
MLQEIYGGGNQSKLKEGISDEQEIRNEIEAPTIKYKTPAKRISKRRKYRYTRNKKPYRRT